MTRRAVLSAAALGSLAACAPGEGPRRPVTTTTTTGAAAPALPQPVSYPDYSFELLRTVFRGDPSAGDTQRWQWQILQADRPRPDGVAHQYRYATAVVRESDPEGVTQCLPPSRVPDSWLLRDESGTPVRRGGGPNGDDVPIDVGNPDFQAAAVDFLVQEATAGGWTGISLDEVNASFLWAWPRRPAAYPDDRSWQEAEVAFVHRLGPALREVGVELAMNIGEATDLDFLGRVTAGGQVPYSEYFVEGGPTGGFSRALVGTDWDTRVRWLERSTATAPATLVQDRVTVGTDSGYGLATFLLATTGAGAYGTTYSYDEDGAVLPPRYDDAVALGAPRTARYEVDQGVWRRDFDGGRVLVNATDRRTDVDGVTLPGAGGLILR